jgi:hypothetical protein
MKLSTRLAIKVCVVWMFLVIVLLTIGTFTNPGLETPVARAMTDMIWGLVLIWVVGGGLLMLWSRDRVKRVVAGIRLDRRLVFFLFAAGLSLTEEAVTVGMTNLAPVFGVAIGQAYITASADYLDVIAFHSVVVFLPMFLVWAWLLSKYSFQPNTVLLLYGLTGVLAESGTFGFQNMLVGGLWILVYGLMVYLPAYTFTPTGAKNPDIAQYALAILGPLFAALPVAVLVVVLFHHPTIEF